MVDIYDWNDLDAVRNDLTASYTLANDLDKDTAGYAGIGDAWTPLGFVTDVREGNAFSGSLNGQGYQISDLVIEENNSSAGGVGFITRVDNGGLVENLSVDGTVDSTIADYDYGGLASQIGENGTGTVQNCASHIDVTVPNGGNVGGLAGDAQGTVVNCYATGSVEAGDTNAGGLAGNNRGTIQTSYAVGSVTGPTDAGALVGQNSFATELSDSYADEQTTGQTSLIGDGSGPSTNSRTLTTSAMQGNEASNTGNMDGFDYTNVWDTVLTEDSDTSADGYPILQALDRTNQLQAQGLYVVPKDGIYIGGTEYDCLVDGTQYDVVQN